MASSEGHRQTLRFTQGRHDNPLLPASHIRDYLTEMFSQELDNRTAWCVVRWTIAGAVLGVLVSSIMCYLQPKRYDSRAVLAFRENPGRSVRLSAIHAAQAIRLTSDSFEVPVTVSEVCDATSITAKDDEVEILVRMTRKFKSREIAIELAWLFRGMDEEEALAGAVADPPPPDPADLAIMEQRRMVERIMTEDAQRAANAISFRVIPSMVDAGSDEAKKLWESEDFQRQWEYHRKVTAEIAGQPQSTLPVVPFLEFPRISEKPSSPVVEHYQMTGLVSGLFVGLLFGFRRIRGMAPISPFEEPARMETKLMSPPLPGSRREILRVDQIEDEW